MAFREDPMAYPVMISLMACIEAEFLVSELEFPGFTTLAPGQAFSHDYRSDADGCADILWIRLATMFPTATFPQPASLPAVSQTYAFQLEIGIVRCIGGLDEQGTPPSADELLNHVRVQLADMAAVRRAICKCLVAADREFLLGSYEPFGPQGGLVGGAWTVAVAGSVTG